MHNHFVLCSTAYKIVRLFEKYLNKPLVDILQVDITVLTVEFKHDKQGKDYMQQFMESKGYKTAAEVKRDDGFANDFVFVKSGYGGF